jgi:hypothetical protein
MSKAAKTDEPVLVPEPHVTSRLSTDGTMYLPETYVSTDGTVEKPWPMTDPMGVKRRLLTDWPIGDARREDPGP